MKNQDDQSSDKQQGIADNGNVSTAEEGLRRGLLQSSADRLQVAILTHDEAALERIAAKARYGEDDEEG